MSILGKSISSILCSHKDDDTLKYSIRIDQNRSFEHSYATIFLVVIAVMSCFYFAWSSVICRLLPVVAKMYPTMTLKHHSLLVYFSSLAFITYVEYRIGSTISSNLSENYTLYLPVTLKATCASMRLLLCCRYSCWWDEEVITCLPFAVEQVNKSQGRAILEVMHVPPHSEKVIWDMTTHFI